MIFLIEHLEGTQFYVVSTGFSGVIDNFPGGLHGVIRTQDVNRNAPYEVVSKSGINVLGLGNNRKYQLIRTNDYSVLRDRDTYGCFRTWTPSEQISYFLPDDTYEEWDALLRPPRVMPFDIEVATSHGRRPNPETDPILMIGFSLKEGTEEKHKRTIVDEKNERDTIMGFLDEVARLDPDIMVGYFCKGFDRPYILQRLRFLGLRFPDKLHRIPLPERYHRSPASYVDTTGRATNAHYESLGFGRVSYDLFESSVKLDTMITTKNKRLKTVSKFFKSPLVFDIEDEEKSDMLTLYEKEREKLYTYLDSDIFNTGFLSDIYLPRTIEMASLARTTLDHLLNARGRAPFAIAFLNRAFIKRNIYPAIANSTRYRNSIYALTGGSYQGALTDIRKPGRYKDVSKLDFRSMYPSMIVTLNISPDTCTFHGRNVDDMPELKMPPGTPTLALSRGPVEEGTYPILKYKETDKSVLLYVPDEIIGKYVPIEVDKTKKGIIPIEIDELFRRRDAVRAEMKTLEKNSPEWMVLNSKQMALKVAANSCYGLMGAGLPVSDTPCAILITALGREISHYTANMLGKSVIEIDTDGFYVDGPVDIDSLNKSLDEAIKEKFGNFPFEPIMVLEQEKKGIEGLFIGMKNYILRDMRIEKEEDRISITGASMKGSSKSKIVEKLLMDSATKVLDGISPSGLIEHLRADLLSPDWKEEDYKMAMSIQKNELEYLTDGGIVYHLNRIKKRSEDKSLKLTYKDVFKYTEQILRKEIERIDKDGERKGNARQDGAKYLKYWQDNTVGIKDIDEILKSAEQIILEYAGRIKDRAMALNYRILIKAIDEGYQYLKGDSLDYYMADSADGVEMFTRANLIRYPINKLWYAKAIENVAMKMVDAVSKQEIGTLF